jgi:hypothetical protein
VSASDDDRISYLAGEAVGSLRPDEEAALDALRAELRAPSTWEEPDSALEDRVVAAIADEAAADGQGASSADHRRARGSGSRRRRLRSQAARFPSRQLSLAAAAAIAAIAAVAAVVLVTNVDRRMPRPEFAMVVLGTSLAPRAHGAATLTKTSSGWRIELSATGLPRRDGRNFYEAWLKNAAGVLVPIGTFNDARHVTLWSGVPVTKFRALTVTQQVANGNPASSGRRVLTGTIR